MNKLTLSILAIISSNAIASDFPIYVSIKKDEEMVSKLFETTRRVDISTKFGMWKQDMLKYITLECADQTKVINIKKNLLLPNEVYSPILSQEDMEFLKYKNLKVGSYISLDKKFCEQISLKSSEELFKQCYVANISSGEYINQNTGYPRDYLVVNSSFKDGVKVDVGVYCNTIEGETKTKQFFMTKGLATWINKPRYQKIQFNGWSEKLMLGSVKIEVDGIKEPYAFATIYK